MRLSGTGELNEIMTKSLTPHNLQQRHAVNFGNEAHLPSLSTLSFVRRSMRGCKMACKSFSPLSSPSSKGF
jgi:hypothetical protein